MKESPVIQLIGALDTVKATDDQSLFDLSFTQNARHARHALALNEDRATFSPTLFDTSSEHTVPRASTSMIQAWFVGSHSDIGGGEVADGLSLYPLQWMLIESKALGLKLEHNPKGQAKGLVENPLTLVFPSTATGSDSASEPWGFTLRDGVKITMYDLRTSHNHGNLSTVHLNRLRKKSPNPARMKKWSIGISWRSKQKTSQVPESSDSTTVNTDASSELSEPMNRPHIIKVNTKVLSLGVPRPVFEKGGGGRLAGHSDQRHSLTTIHPSVYFLQDVYPRLGISKELKQIASDLAEYRKCNYVLRATLDPWVLERQFRGADFERKDFRILICGRAGIGKSTLINKVFGEDLVSFHFVELGRIPMLTQILSSRPRNHIGSTASTILTKASNLILGQD